MSDTGDKRPRQDRGLPREFIRCPREDLIVLIARMLNTLIEMNDDYNNTTLSTEELTRFHSRTPPGISVHSYLARLARYSSLENAVLLAAVYYIDLLTNVYKPFTINSLTVHRFLLTVTTVGSKGLCDSFCTNTHYAKVGGIHANELDILEKEFLQRIKYRVLPRELNLQKCALELQTELSQGRKNSLSTLEQANTAAAAAASSSAGSSDTAAPVQPQNPNPTMDINADDFRTVHLRPNSGFTLLQQLYENMIGIVGRTMNKDDSPVAYDYFLDPNYTPEADQVENNLINTDPDTLEDQQYRSSIVHLLQQSGTLREQATGPLVPDAHVQHLHQMAYNSQVDPLQRRRRADQLKQTVVQYQHQQQPQLQELDRQHSQQFTDASTTSTTGSLHSSTSSNGNTVANEGRRRVQLVLPEGAPKESNHENVNGPSLNSNGSRVHFPKSPLKRPIPDSEALEPAGKRTPSQG